MTTLIVVLGALFGAALSGLGLAVKCLVDKNKQIKELQTAVVSQQSVQNSFEKVEEKSDEKKDSIDTGTVADSVAAGLDVLRNIKASRKSSEN